MALRRPPTRVELKADDIEEYHQVNIAIWLSRCSKRLEGKTTHCCTLLFSFVPFNIQVMREKEMAMQDSHVSTPRFASSRHAAKPANAMERKQVAAERIGIGRPRAG